MRYTHILFDADGTLLDFDACEREALCTVLTRFGAECPPDTQRLFHEINISWWKRLERGETTRRELAAGRFAELCERIGLDADPVIISQNYMNLLSAGDRIMDGATEVCRCLSEKCRLYIITNGTAWIQRGRLARIELRRFFSEVFISEEMGTQKPAREFFDYVLDRIPEAARDKILVVGDSLTSDIRGGANAGLDTCWINPQGILPEPECPTYTVSSIKDVPRIILG